MTSYVGGAAASVFSITLEKMSFEKSYFHSQSKQQDASRWEVSTEQYLTYIASLFRHRPRGTGNLRTICEWTGADQAPDSNGY